MAFSTWLWFEICSDASDGYPASVGSSTIQSALSGIYGMASEGADEQKSSLRDNIVFYTTAFFCLVAIFSLFIFLFLVPFFIEPALATIYMEFDPNPVICQTTEASFHRGLSNCQWSSCREGCTKEVYECWHIRVRYRSAVPVGKADSRAVRDRIAQHKSSSTAIGPVNYKTMHYTEVYKTNNGHQHENNNINDRVLIASASTTSDDSSNRMQSVLPADDEDEILLSMNREEDGDTFTLADAGGDGLHVHEARLQPNVKGCGYPPDVECNSTFARSYGIVGANFSCFYSLIDPTLAITQLNIEKVRSELIYCLTVPIILFVISVVYLFYAYFKLYADSPTLSSVTSLPMGNSRSSVRCDHLGLEEVEGTLTCQPLMSSTSHVSAKCGPPFHHSVSDGHHGSKGIVRRAKSGGHLTFTTSLANEKLPKNTDASNATRGTKTASRSPATVGRSGMRLSQSMG